jgi:hypothetical protein
MQIPARMSHLDFEKKYQGQGKKIFIYRIGRILDFWNLFNIFILKISQKEIVILPASNKFLS